MDEARRRAYSKEERPGASRLSGARKASTPNPGERPMEGLTGPIISFIGAVLIGIVVGKYIASKRK